MNQHTGTADNPQVEIAQDPLQTAAGPDLPPAQSVGYLVREAHRAFLRALAPRISRHRVSVGMWYFLRALWQQDGITQRELSRKVRMMEPTTAAALESMERAGLIRRKRNAQDRRKINIHLTDRGRELRDVLIPCAIEVNRIALQGIPTEAIASLRDQLARITHNLDADTIPAERATPEEPALNGRSAPLHKSGREG
jgi:MarR family transcriptional regulator, organic hydroperoxide resistance regulator